MCVYVYVCIYATCHIGMSPEVYGRFLERLPPIQLPKPVPTNKPDLKTKYIYIYAPYPAAQAKAHE